MLKLSGIVFLICVFAMFVNFYAGFVSSVVTVIFFVFLFYFEISLEKKFQLENAHMIFSKQSFEILYRINTYGCFEEIIDSVSHCLENENDSRRKAVLSDKLSESYAYSGDIKSALSVIIHDKALSEEDYYFENLYNFRKMFCLVFSDERSSEIPACYENIKIIENDFLSLELKLKAEILYSFYEERYFDTVYYSDIYCLDKSINYENSFYFFLKAKSLYYIGKYDEALTLVMTLIDENKNKSVTEKAMELKELLT